jgi:prevent-host-death family protein
MHITNLHQAKADLSNLVEKACSGEEVIICKAGKPMAKLIKYQPTKSPRQPGLWKGQVSISADFDILPKTLLDAFAKDI